MTVFKKIILLVAVLSVIVYVLVFSKEVVEGVVYGIDICINKLVPSLFIFMILTKFISSSSLSSIISKPFFFLAKILNIPKNTVYIYILSLIGGYPISALILNDYVKEERISKALARRILYYSVNCSPAFLFSAVGVSLFGDITVGLYLYVSTVLSSVILGIGCGVFTRIKKNGDEKPLVGKSTKENKKSFSQLLIQSVNSASKSMLMLCGLVLLFNGVMNPLYVYIKTISTELYSLFTTFTEITTGIYSLSEYGYSILIVLMFAVIFGGICVHIQILALGVNLEIRYPAFFLTRVIHSLLGSAIFLIIFPQKEVVVSCFSYNQAVESGINSNSFFTAFFLLLMIVICIHTVYQQLIKLKKHFSKVR